MSAREFVEEPAGDGALAPVPMPTRRGRLGRRRSARRRSAGAAAAEEVRAELVLLREENARLKAARHQLPSFDRVVGQARTLLAPDATDARAGDRADEATDLLVDIVVLRESLVAVCEELERSLAAVRARLDRLGAEPAREEGDGRPG
jgi:hypothetical protein